MIKLLIYDLDGTLIDSRLDIANSVNWTLNHLGLKTLPVDQIISDIGHGLKSLMKKSLLRSSGEVDEKLLDHMTSIYRDCYDEHLLDETTLYPSVKKVLAHFKHLKQAVITNKPSVFSEKILKGLHIDHYFFRIIGEELGFPKKPAPDSVLSVVQAAGVSTDETVFIGDSEVDIQTGRNANVKTIAVMYGFGKHDDIRKENPDVMIHDLSELTECQLLVSEKK